MVSNSSVDIKRLAIFGSTGSIGTQTLDIVRMNPDRFKVIILVAKNNAELLVKQAIEFKPTWVAIENKEKYDYVKNHLSQYDIQVFKGQEKILELATYPDYDFMVAAIVGFIGLFSVVEAIKCKKTIGLANKESIVVAGNIITDLARKNKVSIIPIDSEHSAIFQSLVGEQIDNENITEIILTASGGPFRGRKPNFLQHVKKEHALQHPIWSMGDKISIDSATLMNKGLELIEAKWLFDIEKEKLKILVHPEGIIHGMVGFVDGSYKVQMSTPNMRVAIQYALTYPNRIPLDLPALNFAMINKLTLEEPDIKTFRCLAIAQKALYDGGNRACILNAANEQAVYAFLENKISFLEIPDVVEQTLTKLPNQQHTSIHEYQDLDLQSRKLAQKEIDNLRKTIF